MMFPSSPVHSRPRESATAVTGTAVDRQARWSKFTSRVFIPEDGRHDGEGADGVGVPVLSDVDFIAVLREDNISQTGLICRYGRVG